MRMAVSFSFSVDAARFRVPLMLPRDRVRPENFVGVRVAARQGLYIDPNIWHEGVCGVRSTPRCCDQQGEVHARVAVDCAREFGCLIKAALA
jgi:hypothetical protein